MTTEKEFDIVITVNITAQLTVTTSEVSAEKVYEDMKVRLSHGDTLDAFTRNAPKKVRLEILQSDKKELDRVVVFDGNEVIHEEEMPKIH